jgi:serine protease
LSDVADAIVWASGGEVAGVPRRAPVDVINLSLRMPGACGMAMGRAIAQARSRGTAVVAAAGNDSIKASGVSPANCPGVISVAALARDGSMAWYSNYGDGVTVAAPGGSLGGPGVDDILSSVDAGQRGRQRPIFKYYAGTSMAAPQVAGLVALMRSVDPLIGVDEITAQLIDNARPLPGPCPKGCGAGLIDAGATVDAVVEDRIFHLPPS